MKRIIAYFIKYNITGDVLLFVILLFGFFGLQSMRSTFFPENETKLIAIQVTYPGASPEEVEEGIVLKIEENLKGLTGIDRVTSISQENNGQVYVEIKRGYDIDNILQEINNAVDQINSFPIGIESPIIFKQEVLTVALNFAISGNTDLKTLKQFARDIEEDLIAQNGISKVSLSGFPDEEIEIAVREVDLRAHNMTFDQLVRAVNQANLELTGGKIKAEEEELLIRSRSKGYYAEDLKDVVVAATPDGRRIRLYEVADVQDKWADNPNRTYVNGQPAVKIQVSNTIDENLLEISDYVGEYVEAFNKENTVVHATIIQDGSVLLRQRIQLLEENGFIGIILVLVLLAMFLQFRLAFWVALAIPVSFMGMFMLAPFLGVSINVISLFGMILVIGILVDDGIVISENIYQHFESGKDRFTAAVDGTIEVLPAVLSAILTTMVAFGSFLFLEGITGDFFSEMAVVVILTLAFSLVEGAFILPGHVSHSKALSREKPKDPSPVTKFFTQIQDSLYNSMLWLRDKLYAPSLDFLLKNPLLGMAIPIGIMVLCFGLVGGGFVKTTFFPVVENDYITSKVIMPSGTREFITEEKLKQIEEAVWRVNDQYKANREDGKDIVEIINRSIGPTTYEGNLLIALLDSETRQVSTLEISDKIRQEAGIIYGAEDVIYGVETPFGKPVSVSMKGNNLETLDKAATELKNQLLEVSDLRDITDSNQEGLREIDVKLKEKARLLGLDLRQVVGQVRQGFFGAEVQRLQRGQDEVKVWVRYDISDRSSIGKLENMRIRTPDGQEYPLREIASFSQDRGVITINRLEGQREIRIEADVAAADVSSTDMINLIETELLPPILGKYPDISYSLEGQVRENAKTQRSAQTVLPIALILILLIIILTFRSFGQTLAVLAGIPFGLIGVILGHWIFGKPISILSGLGIFALIGIMVNDSLVLVSQHNILVQQGKSFQEALREASISRFRPIFLTSITTIAGLMPLIFEKSFQAQFLIPMAISVAFGLIAAVFIVLYTLPILLKVLNQYKVHAVWLWEGVKPDSTSVEPAIVGRKNYFLLWLALPAAAIAIISIVTLIF